MNRRSIRYEQDRNGRGHWIANGSYFRNRNAAYEHLDRCNKWVHDRDIEFMYMHTISPDTIKRAEEIIRKRAPEHLFDMDK